MTPRRVLAYAAALLVIKVTVGIVLKYVDYFPPDFSSDFLLGRDAYFFGSYRWAFYAHIVVGPLTLLAGLFLVSERLRQKFPRVHRCLGRVHVFVVLFVLLPSGLWMAFRAAGGPLATMGFVFLSLFTGLSAAMGWRLAIRRRFVEHRRWMGRCFLLLCSTVVLRLMIGLASLLQFDRDWIVPCAVWVSWLLPLLVFEAFHSRNRLFARRRIQSVPAASVP